MGDTTTTTSKPLPAITFDYRGEVSFEGSISNGVDANGKPLGKGYEFNARNSDPAVPMTYSTTYLTQGTLPPFDAMIAAGPQFNLGKNRQMHLSLTMGPYFNMTQYQADTVPGLDDNELRKNRLTGDEVGGDFKAKFTFDLRSKKSNFTLPLGAFVEGRAGTLLLNSPSEDGSFYAGAAFSDYTPGEAHANPLVGEIGGGVIVSAFSLGLFYDTGTSTKYSSLGSFTQYDVDGNPTGDTRNTSFKNGPDEVPSSIDQLDAGRLSVKVSVDLFAIARGIGTATQKAQAAKKAAATPAPTTTTP